MSYALTPLLSYTADRVASREAHNTIGAIEVTDADDHNIVNVEFYDQSTRKGYSFPDNDRYSLAALGKSIPLHLSPPLISLILDM